MSYSSLLIALNVALIPFFRELGPPIDVSTVDGVRVTERLILLAVPPGLAGVLLLLAVTDTTLNVMSLMGVVMMVGIVVSNSILIVEFTRRLRREGRPLKEAVVLACRVRLRPVLMTSLATLIGLLPMAAKLGTGSEAYAPLARAIIGGLGVSVVLTIFIVPAAYFIAHRRREGTEISADLNPRVTSSPS